MPAPPSPTPAEIEILQVLWSRGPGTVRVVHDELSRRKDVGYTTILKLMQIMAEKGLLKRDESQRSHVYRPAIKQSPTQRRLAKDLIDRVFAGSTQQLIIEALASKRPSQAELDEIRKLIDQYDRGKS